MHRLSIGSTKRSWGRRKRMQNPFLFLKIFVPGRPHGLCKIQLQMSQSLPSLGKQTWRMHISFLCRILPLLGSIGMGWSWHLGPPSHCFQELILFWIVFGLHGKLSLINVKPIIVLKVSTIYFEGFLLTSPICDSQKKVLSVFQGSLFLSW